MENPTFAHQHRVFILNSQNEPIFGPELQTQTHGKNSQNEPIFGPELQTQTHGKNSISKRAHQSKLDPDKDYGHFTKAQRDAICL
jgi:hypothetical protein